MSPICIAVVALKGGSGKTTTAINLLAGMASHRVEIEDGVYEHPVKYNRVLLIDTDPQSSLTMHITNNRCSSTDTTIYEVMTKKVAPMDAINKNQYPHIIPSEIDKMGGLDVALQKWPDAIYRLKKAVDEIKASGEYDVIVIDTPPNLSLATQAAICAADRVIITVQVDKYNIESIMQINGIIQAVQESCNPNVKTAGILLTMYDDRANVRKNVNEAVQELAEQMNISVFSHTIHATSVVVDAQIKNCSILKIAPYHKASIDYKNVALELMMNEGIIPQTPFYEYDDKTQREVNKELEKMKQEEMNHENDER